MSTPDNCKDGASKSNCDDGVCEMSDMLHNMSTANNEDSVSVCANCGKEGDVNNICNKCKQVKYCNAACKKKHRSKHKKDCEEHIRLAAEKHNEELRIAAELHDQKLFKQPPPKEDCPLCFQRMPTLHTGSRYKTCCGKVICNGCLHAPVYDDQGNVVAEKVCAFCRTPESTSNEVILDRERKRMEKDDPIAIYNLGSDYRDGTNGFPQDYTKALDLFRRSGELGNAAAYNNIGTAYYYGEGAEIDKKKGIYYYELAAIGGDTYARHNLGEMEENPDNIERASKHHMIAANDGDNDSLKKIQLFYSNGHATKDDYIKALQSPINYT